MLKIENGVIKDARVKLDLCPLLDHGPMPVVHALIMHQTDSSTATSTLNKYKNLKSSDRTGAHFLLDKDGTMIQTLAVNRRAAQVAPIKARCEAEHRCTPADLAAFAAIVKKTGSGWNGVHNRAVGLYEAKKIYPVRWPWNPDAVGIEVVGLALPDKKTYEQPSPQQDIYLHWFVKELVQTLGLTSVDVYRHPPLSAKSEGEAAGVTW